MLDLDLKNTFNTDADRYYASRPRYLDELFEKIILEAHLAKDAELLEIGPGTGQATRPFAERGYRVTAVELGENLADKAREVLVDFPNVKIITGAFEDVELPHEQYDLVYSATAIRWIKPEYKFRKPYALLKSGGHLAIIHTEHVSDEEGDEFFFASQPIYAKYHSADQPDNFRLPKLADLQPPEKLDSTLFSQMSFTVFPIMRTYSSLEYVELLATYSPNIALSKDKRTGFLGEIKDLIDRDFGGYLNKQYGMTLLLARKIG